MHKQKSRKCKRYVRKRIKKALEEIKNTKYKVDCSKLEEKKIAFDDLSFLGIVEGLEIDKITEEKIREILNKK